MWACVWTKNYYFGEKKFKKFKTFNPKNDREQAESSIGAYAQKFLKFQNFLIDSKSLSLLRAHYQYNLQKRNGGKNDRFLKQNYYYAVTFKSKNVFGVVTLGSMLDLICNLERSS